MIEPDSIHTSPDGRIRIRYRSDEIRMSLWVDVPYIEDAQTGREIFTPRSGLWSGHHEWGTDGQFTLSIRLYPNGGNQLTLFFDIDAATVRLGVDGEPKPIRDAAALAEKEFARRAREAANAAREAPPSTAEVPRAPLPRLIENRWLDALAGIGVIALVGLAIWYFAFRT